MQAKIRFCFWIVLLSICAVAKAQREPIYVDALIGDSIKVGKKIVVKDSSFYDAVLKPTIRHTYYINNLISLRINEDINKVLPDSFSLSVKVKVIYTAPDTLSDSIPAKILTINYNKNKSYDNKAVFYFTSAHYVEVQVLQITSTYADSSVTLPLALLENRMVIQRDYDMSCTNDAINTIVRDTSTVSTFGELKLSWTPNHVSQMYDVEWTYLDQSVIDNNKYATNGHLDPSKIFKNNATRITTKADTCMIPLLYDGEGILVYRIRGVRIDENGELQTTKWNSDTDTTSANWKYHFVGHERDLNWQASTTFAEEGKRKSVVQYFDGSLRARQVVTRDNTSQTTIVAETLYDKQGRPVIQVMPAPTLSTLIHYTPGFNVKDMNGAEYDKGVYDTLITASDYCNIREDSMSVSSGASQYYSKLNPLKGQGFHQFIPDAHKYPFTQTQYTQDNTGRIYAQSGVDSSFMLGSGKETKYFYFAAKQTELDALFGTEVGDASHYQKNMVRDANGQYSVSYVDMHGRTIATALSGKVPPSLDTLSSWRDSVETDQLLSKFTNVINGNSVDFSTSIFMTREDDVALHYSMAKQGISLKDCKDSSICYNCLYDLTITVTGDCAGCISGKSDTTIKLSNFSLWRVDSTCDLAIPIDTVINLHLKEGGYSIHKSLSISKQGMDNYRELVYLPHNTCSDYDSIYRRSIKLIKDSLTCSVDTLNEATHVRYRDIMLQDLYPLVGQYGDTATSRSCFSIFNKASTGKYYYQAVADTGACYQNEAGVCDLVSNSNGDMVRPEQLTPDEFISNFKDSWAIKLLSAHPEYRLLMQYEKFATSLEYDDDFEKTDTYAAAVAKGYLNPTNSSASPANKFTGTPHDPLFDYSFAGTTAKNAIEDSLFAYHSGNGVTLTAWGFATTIAKCQETPTLSCASKWNNASNVFNTDSLCTGELDMAWRAFRSFYLTQKREWIDKYIHSNAGVPAGSVCIAVFPTRDEILASSGFTAYGNESNQNAGRDSANAFYQSNCEAYVDQWKEELGNSCYTEVQKDSIIKYMLQVCKEGADSTHPFGASTVRPTSINTYRSFSDVFVHFNALYGVNSSNCNEFLISKPQPYSQPQFIVSQDVYSKPDSCTCTRISGLYGQYVSDSAAYADFSDYIHKTLNTSISNSTLDSLRNLCNGTITCKFLATPLTLPPALQCGASNVCIGCSVFNQSMRDFVDRFPGVSPVLETDDSVQLAKNRIFENFMNQQFGFTKSYVDYINFMNQCDSSYSPSRDSLNDVVSAFRLSRRINYNCGDSTGTDSLFTVFFNNYYSVSYTRAKVDSILGANGYSLSYLANEDCTTDCKYLDKLLAEYYNANRRGINGTVEIDMRTYAGNITPAEGPKGVFDVNGVLLGNTVDGTTYQINQSYASIWNTSVANQSIGTLTALSNGRFSLALNPGQQAPCEGIIGQRFYQYELGVKDSSAGLGFTGNGTYIDFGDSTHVLCRSTDGNYFIYGSTIFNDGRTTVVERDAPHLFLDNYTYIPDYTPKKTFAVGHKYYKPAGTIQYFTVTFYHTDVKGLVELGEAYSGGDSLMRGKNLRGYFPQHLLNLSVYHVQDSTFARSSQIKNFAQINSLEKVYMEGYDWGTFLRINFQSFANNHNLKYIQYSPVYPQDSATLAAIGGKHFYEMFPNLPLNFPNLRVLRVTGLSYRVRDLDSINFSLPNLMHLELQGQAVKSYQIDSILNQLARVNTVYDGTSFYNFGVASEPPTSASTAAIATLKSRNWNLWGIYPGDPYKYYPTYGPWDYDRLKLHSSFTDFFNQKLQLNHSDEQMQSAVSYAYYECHSTTLDPCSYVPPVDTTVMLCGKNEPMNEIVNLKPHLPCEDSTDFAIAMATQLEQIYRDSLIGNFNETYTKKCLKVAGLESLTISKPVSEYHYTLYYYDQAGNLVKTIPPAGVTPIRRQTFLDSVLSMRNAGLVYTPQSSLQTVYRYNSLNQVVSQKSPDGGLSKFWYDRLGRLAISQNAKQRTTNNYSYTRYDAIGRIVEVGQKLHPNGIDQSVTRNPYLLNKWLDYRNFEQIYWPKMVTHTFYDNVSDFAFAYTGFTPFRQKPHTLRNRVSYTRYYDELGEYGPDVYGTDSVYLTQYHYYNTGTEYSYDIHGNVDSMIRIFYVSSIMSPYGHNWLKLISYKYDLISGKVNEVHYNPGEADEFYHRYEYDAENRLTDVYTADNKAFMNQPGLEEHDAHYDYYRHGPLARMVIGQQQVQGIDYAYTLQGWLKGVNSTSMNPNYDMGQDGKAMSANQFVAKDEYGFNLNYFTGDYSSISGNAPFPGHSGLFTDANNYRPLYNGNISSMAVNIKKISQPQLYNYKYDQLNRITKLDVFRGLTESSNEWANSLTPVGDYQERIAYDANGNILKYHRQGVAGNLDMDKLAYHYNANTNQLNYVEDSVSLWNYPNDIDNQSLYNYQYDEIGNLVHDESEGSMNITWNVYGKITNINRYPKGDNSVNNTEYRYDESGNRVGKFMWYYVSPDQNAKYDWYVRDAQGNVLAVYEAKLGFDWNWGPLKLIEHHVYGSSRLGIIQRDQNMDSLKVNPVNQNLIGSTWLYYQQRGKKLYELSNHLDNVLVTISDKKLGHVNGSTYDYYNADVVNATDYYPFGMMMPSRSYSAQRGYRYGFNGKENDNEVKGEGNELDYGMRVSDPRLGRFLSTDPLTKDFPWYTPYQFAGNKPIQAIDLDGLEEYMANVGFGIKKQAQMEVANQKQTSQAKATTLQNILKASAQNRASGGATISQLDMSYGAVQRRQELKEQYQFAKNMSGATMDPVAGGIAYQGLTTAKSYVQGTMQHAYGVYQGIKEGEYGNAAKNAGLLALDLSPLLVKGSGTVTETYYRTMTAEDAAIFMKTGKIPASSETFISPTLEYTQKLKGVTFEINVKSGTTKSLLEIGVSDPAHTLTKPLQLPKVSSGWTSENAFFKMESDLANGIRPQINVGLGKGKALETFNSNIVSYKRL